MLWSDTLGELQSDFDEEAEIVYLTKMDPVYSLRIN